MNENNLGVVGVRGVMEDGISAPIDNIIGSYQRLNNQTNSVIENLVQTQTQIGRLSNEYMALFAVMQSAQTVSLVASKMTAFAKGSIDSLVGLGSTLVDTGAQFEGFSTQLTNLFHGNTVLAEQEMNNVIALAQKVQGDVSDIIGGAINLRLRDMNPFQIYGENTKQELLQYAADLAASMPGKSTADAIRAIGEAYAGQWVSMWRVFNVGKSEFEKVTGKAMSSTLEGVEAMEAVVKYLESKGIAGLQVKMSQTLMGVKQNIQDVITIIKKQIADQGFYQGVVASFNRIYHSLLRITSDQSMKNMLTQISDTFAMLWRPIDKLIGFGLWFVNFMKGLSETSPQLFKLITALFTITSVVLLLSGLFIGFAANILQTAASILIMIQYMREMVATSKGAVTPLKALGSGLATFGWAILKFIGIVGLLTIAWKTDFAGMKTATLDFFAKFKEASEAARYYMETPFEELDNRLYKLQESGNNLANKFANIGLATKAIFTMLFNDNTISTDLFKKLESRGLLPFVEDIADIVYRVQMFFGGVRDALANVVDGILSVIKKLFGINLPNPFRDLTKFLSELDPQMLYNIGKGLTYIVLAWLGFKAVLASSAFLGNVLVVFSDLLLSVGAFFERLSPSAAKGVIGGGILALMVPKVKELIDVFKTLYKGVTSIGTIFSLLGDKAKLLFARIAAGVVASMAAMGPWGWAIMAIVVIIGAMILNWDKVKDVIGKVTDKVNGFIDKVKEAYNAFKNFIGLGPKYDGGSGYVSTSYLRGNTTFELPSNLMPESLDSGGYVVDEGVAKVHKGEVVLTNRQVKTAMNDPVRKNKSSGDINNPQIDVHVQVVTKDNGETDIEATGRKMAVVMWEEFKRIKEEDDMRSFNDVYSFS